MPRSQVGQIWKFAPATKQFSYKWPGYLKITRGLDPKSAWTGGKLLANRPYVNLYQKSINPQPLSYMKQNVWPSKGYQPSLWNSIPVNDVPFSLYYNPKSLNTFQHAAASSRSNVDEDRTFVEERIQEYYDQRLNKNRNKWMFKPVQGTTHHLKEIFIGRCWDFVTNKGNFLQDPSKLDCQQLWKAFLKSFAFKGPCDVTVDDYIPFFNMYKEKPLNDRVQIVLDIIE